MKAFRNLATQPVRLRFAPRLQARSGSVLAFVRGISRTPIGLAGLAIVSVVLLLALIAPCLPVADPGMQLLSDRLQPPSWQHWLGTDTLGRDILSRMLFGARPTLLIVAAVLLLSVPFGMVLGAAAGLFARLDTPLMRVCDMFMAFPRLILAISLAAMLGAGIATVIFAIALTGWPRYARLARAEISAYRNAEFVQAARALGASPVRLLFFHALPLCTTSAIARAAMDASSIILITSSLGFMGFSVLPPQPEWGGMIADGRDLMLEAWWVATMPGLAILLLSIGFSLVGDSIRDALDPSTP